VSTEKLVQQLKAPKDVRVVISSAGAVEAACKACAEPLQPAIKDGLLWLVCARCRGTTFLALANLPRDMRLAEEAGGLFDYEVFFVRDLPPQLSPPNPSQSRLTQPPFIFTVESVFYSEPPVDRVLLVGAVNLGAATVGDPLIVLCQSGSVAVVLEDILTLDRGRIPQAIKGQEVCLALRGIRKEQPAPGDCVVASHV
jgi:hypothetical protein